ncbi:MAG: hypothetical protein ACMXYF_00895 [Candidatus Woesearchaeota archaeon]
MSTKQTNITYEKLFDYVRTEATDASLQKLPESFFADIIFYLQSKKVALDKAKQTDSLFGSSQYDDVVLQLKNAKKLIEELYDRREKKIIHLALSKSRTRSNVIDTSNLLDQERSFFQQLVDICTQQRATIIENIFELRHPSGQTIDELEKEQTSEQSKGKESGNSPNESTMYVCLEDIPELVGPDMETYGPFSQNQQIELPKDLASILLESKRIEPIQEEKAVSEPQ